MRLPQPSPHATLIARRNAAYEALSGPGEMKDRRSWIELLFKRGHGRGAFATRFLLDRHRQLVEEHVQREPDGREALRAAALDALNDEDPLTIVQALSFLLVAGVPADLGAIERFTNDPHERIRKAANTARFELRQMARRS